MLLFAPGGSKKSFYAFSVDDDVEEEKFWVLMEISQLSSAHHVRQVAA